MNRTIRRSVADAISEALEPRRLLVIAFEPGASFPAGPEPFSTVTADLDGDGVLDLAVGSTAFPGGGVTVFTGQRDGSFDFLSVVHPYGISPTAADFDRD